MSAASAHFFTLPSGDKIPALALGTASPPGVKADIKDSIKAALEIGYRHLDLAPVYGNEADVGEAIKSYGIDRKELFLTSKLWNKFHAPEDVEEHLDGTLKALQTDYLDLYLIHWPVAFKKNAEGSVLDPELTENQYATWQKLEELVDKGKIRNIGVSNFNIRRLTDLLKNPIKYKPAVNQVELSYLNPQPELVKWSKDNGIVLAAYSPLGSNAQHASVLGAEPVQEVSKDTGLAPAQVILSWLYQRGAIVLPKSLNPVRVKENAVLTELSQANFDKIEKGASSKPASRVWNPSKGWGLDIFEEGNYP